VSDTPPSSTNPNTEDLPSPTWRRATPWAIGAAVVLLLIILFVAFGTSRRSPDERALGELGFIKATCSNSDGSAAPPDSACLALRAKPTLTASEVAAAIPHLKDSDRKIELNLANTQIENLDPLKELDTLDSLDLTGTPVWNLDALKDMHSLKRLVLHRTDVENIAALKGLTGLQSLTLWDTRVSNLDALKNLTDLRQLDLRDTDGADDGARIPLTVSIGVSAHAMQQGADLDGLGRTLVEEADRAMYKAKSAGRNRVVTLVV